MNIEIIKSNRKSVAIEIKPDLRVVVRAPMRMSNVEIQNIIEQKSDWINKNISLVKSRVGAESSKERKTKFSPSEIDCMIAEARKIIPSRAEYFAKMIGVSYNRVSVKSQISRWGSCSALKNLNFNCLLVLCPPEVRDYVIIHELCHLKELNHSNKFWAEVKKYCPDYKKYQNWLKTYGNQLIWRLR